MNQANPWICKQKELLPDFIIGGTMKSGTSTLHSILNQHPDVFIPKNEVSFFDIDDLNQHGDFFFFNKVDKLWEVQELEKDPEKFWSWYLKKFENYGNFTRGVDSTTYLASSIAANRISIQNKKIKIIFILRQPSDRVYSQYYHLLRTGRALYSFEDQLKFEPTGLINRSHYFEQLQVYYKLFNPSQIKVVLFEELLKSPEMIIKDLSIFLGIEFDKFKQDDILMHTNKARVPRFHALKYVFNRNFRAIGNYAYTDKLPLINQEIIKQENSLLMFTNKIMNKFNPMVIKKKPKMNAATKEMLDSYFKKKLLGIDELTGLSCFKNWF